MRAADPDVAAHPSIDAEWLGRHGEDVIDPARRIVDAHHHLWDRSRSPRYMPDDLLGDVGSGHNVISTVFVESRASWRQGGPEHLRTVGETEFANGMAALAASGDYGPIRFCAGIVANIDLRLPEALLAEALQAHRTAGGGRLKGVRQVAACHDSPDVRVSGPIPPPGLLASPEFRRGFRMLSEAGLGFDAWVYHPQIPEVASLADHFPESRIVLNHCGGPIGIGPYANQRARAMKEWDASIRDIARRENVFVKLGGLGMRLGGFELYRRARPPGSDELAALWSPYFNTCIEAFGASRCMFESNFPVEKSSCSYGVLWNAFKRVASGATDVEKECLFSLTASSFYRLDCI